MWRPRSKPSTAIVLALIFGFVLVFKARLWRRLAGVDDAFAEPEYIEVMDPSFVHAVGSAGIDEAHRRGLPHQGANVLVLRPPARPGGPLEVMVQERSAEMLLCPDTELPGMGEHAHPGETMPAAASRGLREELNLQRPVADLVNICTYHYNNTYTTSRGPRIDNMRVEWFYWVLPPGTEPKLDSETTAICWREPQALLDIAEHGPRVTPIYGSNGAALACGKQHHETRFGHSQLSGNVVRVLCIFNRYRFCIC